MVLKVQHIGICVKNIDEYIAKMKICGAEEVKERLHSPEAGQTSSLVKMADSYFEFMEPLGEEGVVPKFLAKKGEGFHHIGVYCDDIMGLAKEFEAKGLRVLGDPSTGGFFSSPKETGGILYEFSNINDLEREV